LVLASLGDWLRAKIMAARFAIADARFVTSIRSGLARRSAGTRRLYALLRRRVPRRRRCARRLEALIF